jgi:2-isopropylmalate synthase
MLLLVLAAAAGIVLGKHSGRHALASHLHHLGYDLSKQEVDELFKRFKVRQPR